MTKTNTFQTIAQTNFFDKTICHFIEEVEDDTDEDPMSDGGSDYEEEEEEVLHDEVLEFDDDDVVSFVDRANYFLHDPQSAEFFGMDATKATQTKKLLSEKSDGRYRTLTNDQQLFDQILTSIQHLLSPEALRQVWHNFDTNLNENMNNMVASYAPKHCHYSSSLSLNTRIAIAAGTQIVGHYHFWRLLLDRFDIPMHPSMKEYLQDRDKRRIKKTERNRSSEVKLKRTEKLRDTIKKEIQQDAEAEKQGKHTPHPRNPT
jgi:hypothetical protein